MHRSSASAIATARLTIVPAVATTGPVSVTTLEGTATTAGSFTVTPAAQHYR